MSPYLQTPSSWYGRHISVLYLELGGCCCVAVSLNLMEDDVSVKDLVGLWKLVELGEPQIDSWQSLDSRDSPRELAGDLLDELESGLGL